jgi:macrolide transport system ATP-binding/permease protein
MSQEPLISLRGISRRYTAGDQVTTVLDGIDLDIFAGESVAIIGQSGSGKSTLMNIMGCLDTPSDGTYRFAGRDVAGMDENSKAALRRAHFGFIFQRYQLLADLDALSNVEMPAVYNGAPRGKRRREAARILDQLGLSDRSHHRPSELSGGQQQRVSVARALINGGEVIFADEPTGALDSKSGSDLLGLLDDLHARGHTIITVTHDPAIAVRAQRVIEIKDGQIVSDTRKSPRAPAPRLALPAAVTGVWAAAGRFREAVHMAVRAMTAHKLRSFLTMLGIIIGIASVVSMVALGTGSQKRVLENIASIGTSTIEIRKGTGFGDRRANAITTLVPADAVALQNQPYASFVSPEVTTTVPVTRREITSTLQVRGVGGDYFTVGAFTQSAGTVFGSAALAQRDQVAVIDRNAADTFFTDGSDPVGQTILLDRVPMRVIGVVQPAGTSFGSQSPRVYVPYTTAATRLTGRTTLDSISVRVADTFDMALAEQLITDLMLQRHGVQDFFLVNSDTIRNTITSTAQTLSLLVAAIAVISLLVGGIGVMNIMLVSVTERTREIGVRIAVGARRSDIIAQFLIEAVLVCLIGGALGVGLAMGGGYLVSQVSSMFTLEFSAAIAAAAFGASSAIGILFGYLPARSASRLDPVAALARD